MPPSAPGLLAQVAALLEDREDRALARSIFGTDQAPPIAAAVEGYCRAQLGRAVLTCPLFTQSVGAVFVLDLEDGERVVLKFHGSDESRWGTAGSFAALASVYAVQGELAREGVPCARVLRPPVLCPSGAVAAMSFLDGGPGADPHTPAVRRAIAELCAELTGRLARFRDRPDLPAHRPPRDTLWPRPHNVLFDLTAPGGEWIDDRARAARAVLDADDPPPTLMHTDCSAANVRVAGDAVVAVYDMDSVALTDEPRTLAAIAVSFSYTSEPGGWRWPSRDEACAFVADYERARGVPFTPRERARLDAAAIYALGYTARCERGGDPGGDDPPGSMRALLRSAPARGYFAG
jgi:hypothetical protein